MAKLTELPNELLTSIITLLDTLTLKNLRCTCRKLQSLAAPVLFETLHLFPDDESILRFKIILIYKSLRSYTRKIYLNTCCDRAWDSDTEPDEHEDCQVDEPSPIFKEQISSLNQLSHLKHVVIRFDKCVRLDWNATGHCYHPQSLDFRLKMLEWLFSSLGSLPVAPDALTVRNLEYVKVKDPTISAMMQRTLRGLRELRLYTVHGWDHPNMEYYFDPVETHAITELPSTWLKPTMATLEHLTLYSDRHFGLCPALDLSVVHFPRLKSLALGKFTFCHDDQLDWILAHGPTLRELYLDNCWIIHHTRCYGTEDAQPVYPSAARERWEPDEGISWLKRRYPRRWHHYFDSFRTGLPHLRHFRFGRSDWKNEYPFEKEHDITIGLSDRYGTFRSMYGYDVSDNLLNSFCHEKDGDALWALFRKIGQTVSEHERISDDLLE